ncbi:MAG: ComEC/Rec2 family competence protein [Parcubacteria group bacterium]
MKGRTIFVLSAACFSVGAGLGSTISCSGIVFLILLAISAFTAVFLKKHRILALFFLVCACGCFYPFFYESFSPVFQEKGHETFRAEGRIVSYPLNYDGIISLDLKLVNGQRLSLFVESREDIGYGNVIRTDCAPNSSASRKRNIFFCQNTQILKKECASILCPFFTTRERISENLKRNLSSSSSALAMGILFGDKSGFTSRFKENLNASGTTHIVALSGFNITVIVSFLAVIFFFLPIRWRPFAAAIGILAFILVVGPSASVVRAAIMGSLILLARNSGRIIDVKGPIAFTALAMVIHNPFIVVYDAGFLLSFFALFGIVFIAPRFNKMLSREKEPGAIKRTLVECVSAELAAAPIVFILFGSFNWLSFVPNTMIIWSVPIAMAFSFASGVLSFISDYLALPFSVIAEALLSYETGIINLFACGL